MAMFRVRFREDGFFRARFQEPEAFEARFLPSIQVSGGEPTYEDYTGSYDITPLITTQRLPTENKHMTSDVVVRMIPTSEVQNSAGGVTFTIGG